MDTTPESRKLAIILLIHKTTEMLHIKTLIISLISVTICYGQGPNLDQIKTATQDSSHQYYYPKLVSEFISQPEYYSMEKGIYLYYGSLYSPNYNAFNIKTISEFTPLIQNGNLKKAISVGEKIFQENPVNLDLLQKLGYCYKQENQPDKARLMMDMATVLVRSFESSGDGSNAEKAYRVISVTDEYIWMKKNNLTGKNRRTERNGRSIFDVWEVTSDKSGTQPTLYFEVLYNYKAMK